MRTNIDFKTTLTLASILVTAGVGYGTFNARMNAVEHSQAEIKHDLQFVKNILAHQGYFDEDQVRKASVTPRPAAADDTQVYRASYPEGDHTADEYRP